MQFPEYRARRLRKKETLRRLVRETRLTVDGFVYPLFCVPGKGVKKEVPSMPGQYNLSVDEAVKSAKEAYDLGIPGVLLFGIPEKKDAVGSEAWDDKGVVQRAIRDIKRAVPELTIIADACFCEHYFFIFKCLFQLKSHKNLLIS
jgi:porphobilinogen synthase